MELTQAKTQRHNDAARKYLGVSVLLCLCGLLFFSLTSFAQTTNLAGPGADAEWPDAGKEGVGTATTLNSKVWFTLRHGMLTEVYYPTVDVANVQSLQFAVVDEKTRAVELESEGVLRGGTNIKAQLYRDKEILYFPANYYQVSKSKSDDWQINKLYVSDPQRNTVLILVTLTAKSPKSLYVIYDPSLNNSGYHDTGLVQENALVAFDGDKASALASNEDWEDLSIGFAGFNDGLTQLRQHGRILNPIQMAKDGNIVQVARIKRNKLFVLGLGFGATTKDALESARSSLKVGFFGVENQFTLGWREYVATLPRVSETIRAQFNMAAVALKTHEDKTYRGANVASLSFPWSGNANETGGSGYHAVWARDLYQVATAYMALNDKAAALRALDYLFQKQQKADGSFPRNSWLDGKPTDGGLQLDQVGYPLILAYQLGRLDAKTWSQHIKPAADFIVKNGPATPQERWEEKGGYSPSTIAAEIAGLVCAAEAARRNGDKDSEKKYLAVADEWAANVEKWTATKTGKYGDGNYYLRLSANGTPDAGTPLSVNNADPPFDEREIVDAGFLELVRLGIKRPDDPLIVKSLKIVDQLLKVETPNGAAWYRYNHDAYGEADDGRKWNYDGKYSGRGRLWTLLTGERGEYELAFANQIEREGVRDAIRQSGRSQSYAKRNKERLKIIEKYYEMARTRLAAMQKFANGGLMIPEQIWDKDESSKSKVQSPKFVFGEGTGAATPLCWSMAQFVRLARNLQAGHNLETPDIVAARYAKRRFLTAFAAIR